MTQHAPITIAKGVELALFRDHCTVTETNPYRLHIQRVKCLNSLGKSLGHFILDLS